MVTAIIVMFLFFLILFMAAGVIAMSLRRLRSSFQEMSDEALQCMYKDVIGKRLKMSGTEYEILLDEMEYRGLEHSKDGYDVKNIEK